MKLVFSLVIVWLPFVLGMIMSSSIVQVPKTDVDRMHIRDNLKAVQVTLIAACCA